MRCGLAGCKLALLITGDRHENFVYRAPCWNAPESNFGSCRIQLSSHGRICSARGAASEVRELVWKSRAGCESTQKWSLADHGARRADRSEAVLVERGLPARHGVKPECNNPGTDRCPQYSCRFRADERRRQVSWRLGDAYGHRLPRARMLGDHREVSGPRADVRCRDDPSRRSLVHNKTIEPTR